jgi:hypothetical protein
MENNIKICLKEVAFIILLNSDIWEHCNGHLRSIKPKNLLAMRQTAFQGRLDLEFTSTLKLTAQGVPRFRVHRASRCSLCEYAACLLIGVYVQLFHVNFYS